MFKRVDPFMLVVLSIVTFGIYALIWYINTKDQLNANGAKIPTALFLFLPGLNIYWMWKFCEGLEFVTAKRVEGIIAFLMLIFLGPIGMAIIQDSLNKLSGAPAQQVRTAPPSYQAPPQQYQAPPQRSTQPPTYNVPPPPPPGGSNAPPSIPPPPKKL